jgi:hypothetical protein
MRTIPGTEQFSGKTVTVIGVSHGIAGAEFVIEKDDKRSTLEGALAFFERAGGKRFSLSFSDGTEVLWDWDNKQQAFVPTIQQ